MTHLINQKQGVQYLESLFPESKFPNPEKMEKFFEKSKEYFLIGEWEVVLEETNPQKIIICKGTILKTSPKYEYQLKVFDSIWFTRNHSKYKVKPFPLNYKNKPTMFIFNECCGCSEDNMCDMAWSHYVPFPAEDVPKPEIIEPETEEIEIEVTDTTSESTITESNGRLSDEGWEYHKSKMKEICKNDPGGAENMIIAIWFVRMELKQRRRTIEEALLNASKKYKVDRDLLFSRFQSNLVVWRWAKTK